MDDTWMDDNSFASELLRSLFLFFLFSGGLGWADGRQGSRSS
jgi:hypothetical protein